MIQFNPTITLDSIISAAITVFAVLLAYYLGIKLERGKQNSITLELFTHLKRLIYYNVVTEEQLQFESRLLRSYDPSLLSKFGCFLFPEGAKDSKLQVGNVISQAPPVFLRITAGLGGIVNVGFRNLGVSSHIYWDTKASTGNWLKGFSISTISSPLDHQEKVQLVKDIARHARAMKLYVGHTGRVYELKQKRALKKYIFQLVKPVHQFLASLLSGSLFDLTKIPDDIINTLPELYCIPTRIGGDPATGTFGIDLMGKYLIEPKKITKHENGSSIELPINLSTIQTIWSEWMQYINKKVSVLKDAKMNIHIKF